MWSISCALAVSTGLVSRNSCFSIKFLLTVFVHFALAFLSLTKDWVRRQSSMQAKSLTALMHLKKKKKKGNNKNSLELLKACKNYPLDWARYN